MLDENVEEPVEEEVEEVEDSGEVDSESWRSRFSVKEEKYVVNETEAVDSLHTIRHRSPTRSPNRFVAVW